jgi:hypothetical protein
MRKGVVHCTFKAGHACRLQRCWHRHTHASASAVLHSRSIRCARRCAWLLLLLYVLQLTRSTCFCSIPAAGGRMRRGLRWKAASGRLVGPHALPSLSHRVATTLRKTSIGTRPHCTTSWGASVPFTSIACGEETGRWLYGAYVQCTHVSYPHSMTSVSCQRTIPIGSKRFSSGRACHANAPYRSAANASRVVGRVMPTHHTDRQQTLLEWSTNHSQLANR